jgi:hypothetical protein
MKLRIGVLTLALGVIAGGVWAHGNKVHVQGTVEKIGPDSLSVRAKDGKPVEVKLAASTVYLLRSNNQDKPAKFSDLAIGYLVVIHATPKDNTLEADEVKFSVPTAPKPAVAAPSKAKSRETPVSDPFKPPDDRSAFSARARPSALPITRGSAPPPA